MTRAQLVTMLMRAIRSLDPSALVEPPAGFVSAVGDFMSIHDESMRVAEYNGLLAGLQGYGADLGPVGPGYER